LFSFVLFFILFLLFVCITHFAVCVYVNKHTHYCYVGYVWPAYTACKVSYTRQFLMTSSATSGNRLIWRKSFLHYWSICSMMPGKANDDNVIIPSLLVNLQHDAW